MNARYAFGDSELAARRLDLVAEVFEPPSRAFLEAFAPLTPALAIDLGCGPGHTTRLLADVTGAARVIGLEASPDYTKRAEAAHPGLDFIVHDALDLPFPIHPADLISCRYLLAHLADPDEAVRAWLTQLQPGGRLLVDEPHELSFQHPVLRRYEDQVVALLEQNNTSMYPGDAIDVAGPIHRQIVTYEVPVELAARMFALNFAVWGDDPQLAADLDALSRDGTGSETWHLYQAVFEAPA